MDAGAVRARCRAPGGRRSARTDLSSHDARIDPRRTGRAARRRGGAHQSGHAGNPRDRDQRRWRIRLRQRGARRVHRPGITGRIPDRRTPGHPHCDPADAGVGLRAPDRRPHRTGDGDRRGAPRRARDADGGRHDVGRADLGAADLRPQHLLLVDLDTGRRAERRSAVRAVSGSERLLAAVARRRSAPRQLLRARRRLHHGLHQPRVVGAVDRVHRRHARPGEDLRRRHGPRGRRRLQRDSEVRFQQLARQRAVPDQTRRHDGPALLRQARGPAEGAADLLRLGRFGGRPHQDEPHVLLVQQGRLLPEELAQQRPHVPDGPRTTGRLLAVVRRQRAAHHDLRSADDAPEPERHRLHPRSVPGQRDPGRPDQSRGARDDGQHAAARLRPVVQRPGLARGRSAAPGNPEDRSPLEQQLDDVRHVWTPVHEGTRLGLLGRARHGARRLGRQHALPDDQLLLAQQRLRADQHDDGGRALRLQPLLRRWRQLPRVRRGHAGLPGFVRERDAVQHVPERLAGRLQRHRQRRPGPDDAHRSDVQRHRVQARRQPLAEVRRGLPHHRRRGPERIERGIVRLHAGLHAGSHADDGRSGVGRFGRELPAGQRGQRLDQCRHAGRVPDPVPLGLRPGRVPALECADAQFRSALRVRARREREEQPVHGGLRA